jgi:N-acylneuraminate cytidylyltransferase
MKAIAIIPARGGSKSIPGKNIVNFCGRPLIAWSIKQAKASKYIEDVYVTSDDREILSISRNYGAQIINRPKRLATDTSGAEETLLHAIKSIREAKREDIDIVVFLQPTSPLRTSKDIDKAIELFRLKKADSLFSAALLEDFCVWKAEGDKLLSVTYDYQKRGRRQDRKPYYLENGSIYIFKPQVLRKYNNRLGDKIVIYTMPFWQSYEIDNLEDLEICKYFMKNKIL